MDEIRARRDRIEIETFRIRSRFAVRFGHQRDERGETVARRGGVRKAFNSPFRPFILATTSIGQEGLDFHTYCHAVYHWNLPTNPVDLEQREGRVHRYKGHAIRKNVARHFGLDGVSVSRDVSEADLWRSLFQRAVEERPAGANDLVPFWVFDDGPARVERRVPLLPLSRETSQLDRLKSSLAVYRMVFGQPRQEDLLAYLEEVAGEGGDALGAEGSADDLGGHRISLAPPEVELEQEPVPESEIRVGDGSAVVSSDTSSGRAPETSREMMERMREDIRAFAPGYELRDHGNYVGFETGGHSDNFVYLNYRKYGVRIDAKVREDEPALEPLRKTGCKVFAYREYTSGPGTYPVRVTFEDFRRHRELISDLLRAAFDTSARRSG